MRAFGVTCLWRTLWYEGGVAVEVLSCNLQRTRPIVQIANCYICSSIKQKANDVVVAKFACPHQCCASIASAFVGRDAGSKKLTHLDLIAMLSGLTDIPARSKSRRASIWSFLVSSSGYSGSRRALVSSHPHCCRSAPVMPMPKPGVVATALAVADTLLQLQRRREAQNRMQDRSGIRLLERPFILSCSEAPRRAQCRFRPTRRREATVPEGALATAASAASKVSRTRKR